MCVVWLILRVAPYLLDFTARKVAAIEQIIASKAEVFFGTSTSTFSKEIHLERYLDGFDWTADVSLTLLPGGDTAKMCDYEGASNGGKRSAILRMWLLRLMLFM